MSFRWQNVVFWRPGDVFLLYLFALIGAVILALLLVAMGVDFARWLGSWVVLSDLRMIVGKVLLVG